MPTLSLIDPTAADGWHNIRAPGGYEAWQFYAEDDAANIRVTARFHDGYSFHPEYLRRYRRYLRQPTKNTPPLPAEYRCVELEIHRPAFPAARYLWQIPSADFEASSSAAGVRMGQSWFRTQGNAIGLHVQTPAAGRSIDLEFQPILTSAAFDRIFFAGLNTGEEHHWSVPLPLCRVRGKIDLPAGENSPSASIDFAGRGAHDHLCGLHPIALGLRRWFRGCVLFPDAAVHFQIATPGDVTCRQQIQTILCDAGGSQQVDSQIMRRGMKRHKLIGLRYPRELRIGGLFLTGGTVIDSSPFDLRLVYQAEMNGRKSTAVCELAYPR